MSVTSEELRLIAARWNALSARVAERLTTETRNGAAELVGAEERLLEPWLRGDATLDTRTLLVLTIERDLQVSAEHRAEQTRGALAFHEAGHAVAAAIFGLLDGVTTIDGPIARELRGFSVIQSPRSGAVFDTPLHVIALERMLVVEYCGPAAQRRSRYWPNRDTVDASERHAERLALHRQPPLDSIGRAAWLAFAHAQAESLVAMNMPSVERVADALAVKRTLSKAEVEALVRAQPSAMSDPAAEVA